MSIADCVLSTNPASWAFGAMVCVGVTGVSVDELALDVFVFGGGYPGGDLIGGAVFAGGGLFIFGCVTFVGNDAFVAIVPVLLEACPDVSYPGGALTGGVIFGGGGALKLRGCPSLTAIAADS